MSSGIELACVNPWLYIKENPLTTYQWWRYEASNFCGSPQWVSSPLGYFTGPDSIVIAVWAGYRVPGAYSLTLRYTRELKGQNTLDTPYAEGKDAVSLAAPSGIVETKNVVHVRGEVQPLPSLGLALDLFFVMTQNLDNVRAQDATDLQIVTSVRFRM